MRSRANRKLAQWSPAKRRVVFQVVLDEGGGVAESADAASRLMQEHWGPISGDATPIDDEAARTLLSLVQQWRGVISLPDSGSFSYMLAHTMGSECSCA